MNPPHSDHPSAPVRGEPLDDAAIDELRPRRPRVMRFGIAISVVAHVIAIAMYSTLYEGAPEGVMSVSAADSVSMDGIVLVELESSEEEEETERPETPAVIPVEPSRPIEVPPVAVGEETIVTPEVLPPAPGLTAAERIRETYTDPRMASAIPVEFTNPSPQQIAQLRLMMAVEALIDSTTIAQARESGAVDWTWTDGEGKKWGVGDGKIHLGDVVLPLPVLGSPYDPDAWMGSQIDDLERAASTTEAVISNRDVAKQIRERIEAERRRAQQDTIRGR